MEHVEGLYERLQHLEKYAEPIMSPEGDGFDRDGVLNPSVVKEGDTFYMLYRAYDDRTPYTAQLGLATSDDGVHFTKETEPVIRPDQPYEFQGVEDPRIAKIDDTYVLAYVGINPTYGTSHICLATSTDLRSWDKLGPVLTESTEDWDRGNKKAAVIVPEKVDGRYVMYFLGESEPWHTAIGVAYSDDLVHWEEAPEPVLVTREGSWDSMGVEPGATPVVTDEGILLVYNGWDTDKVHRTGVVMFDRNDPGRVIKRTDDPIIEPTEPWETGGLVPNVTFSEGLVDDGERVYVYYGAADTCIGLAVTEKE